MNYRPQSAVVKGRATAKMAATSPAVVKKTVVTPKVGGKGRKIK